MASIFFFTCDPDVVAEDDTAHAGGHAGQHDEGGDPSTVAAVLAVLNGDDADGHG
jgi:hypothetical protein